MRTAPAIANTIARAIGVRPTALPLTPERVWPAMRGAQAAQKARRPVQRCLRPLPLLVACGRDRALQEIAYA